MGPEALAGGLIGRLRDGDLVRIMIDTGRLEGSLRAALQEASGGPWSGAAYDVDRILELLQAGRKVLEREKKP